MRALQWLTAVCAMSVLTLAAPSGCERLMGGGDDEGSGKRKKKDDDGGDADGGEKAGDEGKKSDDGPSEDDMKVAEGGSGVDGPVPPDTSMVFFTVEGALLPLGCFDKASGGISSGKACLEMVKDGEEVRLASHDSQYNRKTTGRVVPTCLAGSSSKVALGAEGITGGADFNYASWPPAGIKIVKEVDRKTLEPSSLNLDDDEKAKLMKGIKASWSGASGDVEAHQIAELDLDGNDKKDKFVSVFIQHPTMPEQYKWSGAFFAVDGNLDNLVLVAKSASKRDVFEARGTLNLDGAGFKELWVRLNFDEGAGDRLYKVDAGKATGIGKWTCGAQR